MASEIVERATSVPALVRTPALEIGAEDIALPQFKIGQYSSDQVKDQSVKPGALFTRINKEDPSPVILSSPKKKGEAPAAVRFHVLGMTRGKSVSGDDGLIMFDYDDPDAPAGAWTTYNYLVALPDHDEDVPYKWLLTKSGKATAMQINMVIKKHEGIKQAYELAFDVTTAERSNTKGDWFVPRVSWVEAANEKDIEIARTLSELVAGSDVATPKTRRDEPAI